MAALRSVRVRLTTVGEDRLDRLTALHLAELSGFGLRMAPLWSGPEDGER